MLTCWATTAPSLHVETRGQMGVSGCEQLCTWLQLVSVTMLVVSFVDSLRSQTRVWLCIIT